MDFADNRNDYCGKSSTQIKAKAAFWANQKGDDPYQERMGRRLTLKKRV